MTVSPLVNGVISGPCRAPIRLEWDNPAATLAALRWPQRRVVTACGRDEPMTETFCEHADAWGPA